MARIPGFHPGSPASIPGQGIKISLHATTPCCLSEITFTMKLIGNSFYCQYKIVEYSTCKKLTITSQVGQDRQNHSMVKFKEVL